MKIKRVLPQTIDEATKKANEIKNNFNVVKSANYSKARRKRRSKKRGKNMNQGRRVSLQFSLPEEVWLKLKHMKMDKGYRSWAILLEKELADKEADSDAIHAEIHKSTL